MIFYITVNITRAFFYTSFPENSSNSDLRDLLSELDLLKKLKPHPNVIQLKGCLTKDVARCEGKRDLSKWQNMYIQTTCEKEETLVYIKLCHP